MPRRSMVATPIRYTAVLVGTPPEPKAVAASRTTKTKNGGLQFLRTPTAHVYYRSRLDKPTAPGDSQYWAQGNNTVTMVVGACRATRNPTLSGLDHRRS